MMDVSVGVICQAEEKGEVYMISDSAILAAQKIASDSAMRESLIFAGKEIPAHLRKGEYTMSSNAKVTVSQSSIENVVKETFAAMLPSMMAQMMAAMQQQAVVAPTVAPVVAVKPEETPEGNIALTVNKDVLTVKVNLTRGGNRVAQKTGNRYVALSNYAHFYIDENGQYVPCASHKAPSDRTEYSLNLTVMEVKR